MNNNINNDRLIVNNNISPCKSTISNHVNLSVTNYSNILLVSMPSSRLKSLGRITCSESKQAFYSRILIILPCHFRVRKWLNNPNNLSTGAISAEKFAKCMLKLYDTHPIDSRHILCFDEHGHSCTSGHGVSSSR